MNIKCPKHSIFSCIIVKKQNFATSFCYLTTKNFSLSYHDVKLIFIVLANIHSLQNRIPLITYMYEYFKFFLEQICIFLDILVFMHYE